MSFGVGKVFGSFLGGSIQKVVGKLQIIYFSVFFDILATVLMCNNNFFSFCAGRFFIGLYCGFITTNVPRYVKVFLLIKK